MPHCIQYACVGYPGYSVYDTLNLTDDEIIAKNPLLGLRKGDRIERFNRCPVCESWTMERGRLRENIDCPAVKAAIAKEHTKEEDKS